jgi:hypothetical protein
MRFIGLAVRVEAIDETFLFACSVNGAFRFSISLSTTGARC